MNEEPKPDDDEVEWPEPRPDPEREPAEPWAVGDDEEEASRPEP